jgi:hypothetical protein
VRAAATTVVPPVRDRHGDRHVALVGDRHADFVEVHVIGSRRRASVKVDLGLPGAVRQDLDLSPANPAHPEPEHLADGFLRRPASSQALHLAADVAALVVGQDALTEAVREAPEHADDAIDVDEVDPDLVAAHRRRADLRAI